MTLQSIDANSVLKGTFVLQVCLISIALLGHWIPDAYIFYNVMILIATGWAVMKQLEEQPVFYALCGNIFAIVMDILVLATSFPHGNAGGINGLSIAACIFNLLLRPLALFFIVRLLNERRLSHYQTFGGADGQQRDAVVGNFPTYEYPDASRPSGFAADTKPLAP